MLSGYDARFRDEKPLAFLQAFIDDSAAESGEQRLFMAGYLNTARNWTLFEAAWREELAAAPAIDYLKMAEANNLRDQFKGWTAEARDEKLRGLARVVRHFKPLLSFEVSVSRGQYYRLVRPVAPRALGNPHFVSCFCVVTSVARWAESHGIKTPIKFIFDEQSGVSADIHLFFEAMKIGLPKKVRPLIGGTPVFEDDKRFLPLQAADMLAWHLRREHEQCAAPQRLPMADLLRNTDGHLVSHIDESYLRHWGGAFGKVPGVAETQSKRQWQALKREMAGLAAAGYRYSQPRKTRWKNATRALRDFIQNRRREKGGGDGEG